MENFWEIKSLSEMTQEEWESLCDGCGKCCLHKLEDEDTGDVYYTDVACQLLNLHTCRCTDYENRLSRVPDCLQLTAADIGQFHWLPSTCAYRLLSEGESLPIWHHLVSEDPHTIHDMDMSIRGRVVPETSVQPNDMEERIIYWVL